jgi:hypothetical protein
LCVRASVRARARGGAGSSGTAPQGTCLQASGGASDACRSTTEKFCCTQLGSGRVATYTERVFPAGSVAGGSRFCINPAQFFECQTSRCVPQNVAC